MMGRAQEETIKTSLSRAFIPPWSLDAGAIGAGTLSDQPPTNSCSPIGTLVPLRKSFANVLRHPKPLYLRRELSKAHAKVLCRDHAFDSPIEGESAHHWPGLVRGVAPKRIDALRFKLTHAITPDYAGFISTSA